MKALTVGSVMMDTIAIIDSAHIERMSMNNADKAYMLLEEGRKTEATVISAHLGGGAANTAVSLTRLGFSTDIIACVGKDARGAQVVSILQAAGVNTACLVEDETHPTGSSVMIASHDRNASVFTFRGANTQLKQSHLDNTAFQVDLLHICSLSNASVETFPDLVKRGCEAGARISANPGIRQLASRGREMLDVLPKIDVFFFNRAEAEAFMPVLVPVFSSGNPLADKRADEPILSGGGFDVSLTAFFRAIRTVSSGIVVMTDGHRGAYVLEERAISHFPSVDAEVAGTAGAGDAFASTFAGYLAKGKSTASAAFAATSNAASVISHVDTQTGLLQEAPLDAQTLPADWASGVTRWTV